MNNKDYMFYDGTSANAALAANAETEYYESLKRYDNAIDEAIDSYDRWYPNASEAEREAAISRIIDRIDRDFLSGKI